MAKTTSSQYFTRLYILSLVLTLISISILLTPKFAYASGTVTDCTNDADLHDKLASGGVVTFACGPSPVTIPLTTVDDSSGSHISITQTTTINGDGLVTLQGNGSDRIFYVDGSQLSLDGLTLSHGRAFTFTATIHSAGGGVFVVNSGAVTITNSTLSDNQAAFGGAVRFYDGGRLVVNNSSFLDNLALSAGGAILVENQGASPMTATIMNSAMISNTVTETNTFGFGNGGAIASLHATLIIVNSTLSNNGAIEGGAINIGRSGNLTLITNTTIVSNSASNSGGGIRIAIGSGSGNIKNTIIANNTATTGPNCGEDKLTSSGNNIASDSSCDFNPSGDLSNTDPLLGPLANNNGKSLSYAPLPGSPAINAADNTACAADPVNNIDQVGVLRPQGTACDIGALEAIPYLSLVKSSYNEGGTPLQPGERITYTIFVTNTGNLTATGGLMFDPLPAHTTFVPNSIGLDPPGAGLKGSTPPTLASDLVITAGESLTVTYAVTVNSPLPNQTPIVNTASVTSTEISTPQTSAITDTVTSAPILSIQKTSHDANGGSLNPGDTLSYTIVITNTGNLTATGGLMFDPLPAHTTFVPNSISLDPPGAGLPGSTPPTLASDLVITAGESLTVTYAVTVNSPLPNLTVITNTASITSNEVIVPVTGVITNTVINPPSIVFLPLILRD